MEDASPLVPPVVHKFGIWYCVAFIINQIVGSGYLTLPFAFRYSGFLMGILVVVGIFVVNYISATQIHQIVARCESIAVLNDKGIKVDPISPITLVKKCDQGYAPIIELGDEEIQKPVIGERRMDYIAMIDLCLGRRWAIAYSVLYIISYELTLMVYVMLFGATLASTIPFFGLDTCNVYEESGGACRGIYTFWSLVFGFAMMGVTLFNYEEQRIYQFIAFILQILFAVVIIVSSFHLIFAEREVDDDGHDPKSAGPIWDFRYFGLVQAIAMTASSFQSMYPEVVFGTHNKPYVLPRALPIALVIVGTMFVLVAVGVSIAVEDVGEITNIEWQDYTGGMSQSDRKWWAYMIAYFATLFPAFDVGSIFPLISVAVADNILATVFGYDQTNVSRAVWYASRIGVCIPPIIIGVSVTEIATAYVINGVLCVILGPLVTAILSISAKRLIPLNTEYDMRFMGIKCDLAIIAYSVITLILMIVLNLIYYP